MTFSTPGAFSRSPLRWTLALLLLLLAGPAARSQAWQSVVATAGSGLANVTTTATDANGNIYLAGTFTGTVNLGNIALVGAGGGSVDAFVAKWMPGSGFAWAQQASGLGSDVPTALAVSGNNIYVTGYFDGLSISFGSIALTNTSGNSVNSYSDIFVAKLTDNGSTGTFSWVKQLGGVISEQANAVAVSGSNVYVAGMFSSGTLNVGSTTLTNAGGRNGFLVKLTDAGANASFIWAQRMGGTGTDEFYGVAVSGTSVYAAGYFRSATIGLGSMTLANGGSFSSSDVVVAKLTDNGATSSYVWAQRAGGIEDDLARAIAVNNQSVYIAGYIYGTASGFGSTMLASVGDRDAFVAKLSDNGASGNFMWAQRAGGPGVDGVNSLAVSGNNICISGYFYSVAAIFGSTTLTNAGTVPSTTGLTTNDIFVAKLVDAGTSSSFNWAQRAGGAGFDNSLNLTISRSSVYVGGNTAPPASFGTQNISGPTGAQYGYLAILNDLALLGTTPPALLVELRLCPNPARSLATLHMPAVPGVATVALTLTDALGRIARSFTLPLPANGLTRSLDLAGLAPGLYAVRAQAGSTTATSRLVIE